MATARNTPAAAASAPTIAAMTVTVDRQSAVHQLPGVWLPACVCPIPLPRTAGRCSDGGIRCAGLAVGLSASDTQAPGLPSGSVGAAAVGTARTILTRAAAIQDVDGPAII